MRYVDGNDVIHMTYDCERRTLVKIGDQFYGITPYTNSEANKVAKACCLVCKDEKFSKPKIDWAQKTLDILEPMGIKEIDFLDENEKVRKRIRRKNTRK